MFMPVAIHVPLKFGLPELHVGFRGACRLAPLVPMPEAAVHEDDRVPFGKHDIRVSRQLGRMEAVAKTQCVQMASHKHLRLRVLRTNPAHDFAALLGRDGIHRFLCPNDKRHGKDEAPWPCSCHQDLDENGWMSGSGG